METLQKSLKKMDDDDLDHGPSLYIRVPILSSAFSDKSCDPWILFKW